MATKMMEKFGVGILDKLTYSDAVVIQQFLSWDALEMEMNMPKAR